MCDCVKQLNEALKPMNGRIAQAIGFSGDMKTASVRLVVATEKIDKKIRKAVPMAFASFCPFCGEKLAVT